MFHRVKLEEQEPEKAPVSEQKQTAQPQEQETVEVGVREKQDETLELESSSEEVATTETTEENNDVTSTTSPQTKDEDQTMSQQDNDTPEQDETAAAATTMSNPYQRSPMQAAPARGGVAGGYPGASYPGAAANAAASQPSDSDRRLTIGAGITMSGEIEACDYLLVEGTVEAALKGANILEIAESGVFYGTVEINEANIAGRFEGDITVNGRLTISSGGTVTGSISYKEIEIEAGAVIDGKLTPLSAVQAAPAKKPVAASKPAAKAAPAAKVEKQPEPANTDGGLFSKAAAAAE